MLSADLNWLPTSLFKGITAPIVIYEDPVGQPYGGYYTLGTNRLIVVSDDDITVEASTIAHELCHYLQFINGTPSTGSTWEQGKDTYETAIYNYFTTYAHEMEALLYECKYSKNWVNDYWYNKILKEQYFG